MEENLKNIVVDISDRGTYSKEEYVAFKSGFEEISYQESWKRNKMIEKIMNNIKEAEEKKSEDKTLFQKMFQGLIEVVLELIL